MKLNKNGTRTTADGLNKVNVNAANQIL